MFVCRWIWYNPLLDPHFVVGILWHLKINEAARQIYCNTWHDKPYIESMAESYPHTCVVLRRIERKEVAAACLAV